jgi:membrane protein
MAGRFARVKARAGRRWGALKQRYAWLRHVVDAWHLMSRNNGNQYAAAITYFSFLALFPLILLAVSVTGFVLHSDPQLQQKLFAHITQNVPGAFGRTLKHSIHTAIANRSGVGIVGLLGVLLTGLGWIGNLRSAIHGVWGTPPPQLNFVKSKLANLVVLVGLGGAAIVSLGLTVVGTSLTDQILRALSLDGFSGSAVLLKVLGIALAIAGDVVIFWWLIVRLPQVDVPPRIALKGALLAAIGFEVLKVLGSYTIAHTASSPTAGPFAGIVAILVWIQLVARLMLFACAWTATLNEERRVVVANQLPVEEPPAMTSSQSEVSPAAVGVTLVGAGVLAGAAATWALTRPRQTS